MHCHSADRAGTYVLVSGHLPAAGRGGHGVERHRNVVRADGHTILHVGGTWLRDVVEFPRGMLMLVFVRGPGVMSGRGRGLGRGERGLLERGEGRVEGAAERLREAADVFCGGSGA